MKLLNHTLRLVRNIPSGCAIGYISVRRQHRLTMEAIRRAMHMMQIAPLPDRQLDTLREMTAGFAFYLFLFSCGFVLLYFIH